MALSRTRPEPLSDEEAAARRAFHEEAWGQRCCAVCGKGGAFDPHHVVEKKKIKSVRRTETLWDVRNALRLCPQCHADHTGRSKKVPLRKLRDANYEFAAWLLGGSAFYYLRAHYDGDDPRLSALRTREDDGDSTDATAASAL